MLNVNSDRKIIPNLQGSQRITTAHKVIEKQPFFQNIMDQAYSLWNQNKEWSYNQFINNLNAMTRRIVILGNLNYQVENGGFYQWFDNNCCNENLIPLVIDAIEYIKTPAGEKVLGMVKEVYQLFSTKKNNPFSEQATSAISYYEINKFDLKYYKINNQFLYDIEKIIRINKI